MKLVKAIVATLIIPALLLAQRPTAYGYNNTSISSDGRTLYGTSTLQGTMSGSFPPGVIRHTYSASFTLVPPSGSNIQPISCYDSQTGDPSTNFAVSCYQNISLIGIGIYEMNLADSAVCSYAGTFFSDSGTSIPTYTYDANNITSFFNSLSLVTGYPVSTLKSWVAGSGVLLNNQGPLTPDNLNVIALGRISGVGDNVDPTFNRYMQQMGYNLLAPTTIPPSLVTGAIATLIRILVSAGGTVAMGALVLASMLIMTGDHAAAGILLMPHTVMHSSRPTLTRAGRGFRTAQGRVLNIAHA